MINIDRHRVFISYYHEDDQYYKNNLINRQEMNPETFQLQSIFEDCSVHEDEIDDIGLTAEDIRRIIRDNYIKDATVLILLCGKNTKKRKHIDWEIHAAMYDSNKNPKMGILVINLPTIKQCEIACGKDEEQMLGPYTNWRPLDKNIDYLRNTYPYLPERIITNIARDNVSITVVNWDDIANDNNKIKYLIDKAFKRKYTNDYDHSATLKKYNG